MKWQSLISTQNLKLAWRRINTGRNLQYKRFFRESYLVYESGLDDHIRELHKSLEAKAWQATHATRIYLPKPSGLQRPISLLGIEDQIVLQAIANRFATRLNKKRQRVELQSVFSNKLANPKGSIFFMESWQSTYRAFQNKCTESFNDGLKWSAHFDLSAYYDTISHDLLLSIVASNNPEQDTLDTIKQWLSIWSADNIAAITGHGIPQGPLASDFLAEAFFLPVDSKLQKEPYTYIRYVDDIRLFGRTENEVREAAIQLEQECRHRGLIPQSTKFEIVELKSASDAMGSLPSIPPTDGRGVSENDMKESEALNLLKTSISGRPQRIIDKSRFRYVMYRAPGSAGILKIVLRLLPRHPEHIDAFSAYFANFGNRRRIARSAIDYLESRVPYSYVRGELWHIIARLAGADELLRALPMARKDAKSRAKCVALSWGVMHFLIKCEAVGLMRDTRRLIAENPISRSLLAPMFPQRAFAPGGHVVALLKGELMEQLAGARELQKRGVALNSLGLRQKDLSHTCCVALKSLGVIRRRHRRTSRDWFAETLAALYGCNNTPIWRGLLGVEYEHALQLLIEAKARFSPARSEWLSLQDSLSDIVIRQFMGFLQDRGLPGHSKIVDRNGNLVKYGQLISSGSPFDRAYPSISEKLRAIHERRNRLPGSHPYDEKGGTKNRFLTTEERSALLPKVRGSLNDIAAIVNANQ